jgi:glutamate synthase (NADPH/NADH) large chain
LATETREIMASLGFRTVDEMGQYQCLTKREDLKFWKAKTVDLSAFLQKMDTELPLRNLNLKKMSW